MKFVRCIEIEEDRLKVKNILSGLSVSLYIFLSHDETVFRDYIVKIEGLYINFILYNKGEM